MIYIHVGRMDTKNVITLGKFTLLEHMYIPIDNCRSLSYFLAEFLRFHQTFSEKEKILSRLLILL